MLDHDEDGFLVGVSVDLEPDKARFRAWKIQGDLERYWYRRGHPLTLATLAQRLRDGEIPWPAPLMRLVGFEQYYLANEDDRTALDAYADAEKVRASTGPIQYNRLAVAEITLERLTRPTPAQAMGKESHKARTASAVKPLVWGWCKDNLKCYKSAAQAAENCPVKGASDRTIADLIREYAAYCRTLEWCKHSRAKYQTAVDAARGIKGAKEFRDLVLDWIDEYDKNHANK